jgi:HD-GYP domain-containing protein (c-di-GMP phosphodiesterase class II)
MNEANCRGLIWNLVVGISQGRLYSIGHESVVIAAERVRSLLRQFPGGECTLLVVKDDLVLNNSLFREAGIHGEKLVRLLGQKGISRVDFLQDAPADEIRRFFADVAAANLPPAHYAHIRVGRLELGGAPPAAAAALVEDSFHAEQLSKVRAVYQQVSPFRELPIVGLEEVVTTFLLTFRRGAGLLRMLSPVKTHSEHTYTHAVNVSVLAMALAEGLGLKDESVQQIGIAALLHDVGKLLIPKEILHKPGKLSEEEFATIMKHPLYGAAYLARVEGLTPLAVLVALEHHRKFDTSGYPVLRDSGRRQHAASQIVTIADFYDALRSHRPYRRSLTMTDVLAIMHKESGSVFNPGLLDRFTRLMLRAAAEE